VKLALVALLAIGCSKQSTGIVARLEQKEAVVERMARANAPWVAAKVGDGFVIGSAIRTGNGAHAKLKLGKSGKLDVAQNAVIYFTKTPGHTRDDIRVETGVVELEAGDELVGLGEAVLDPHSKAHIENGPAGLRIDVSLGKLVLEDNVIAAGQSITLGGDKKKPATAASNSELVASDRATKHGLRVAIGGKPARAGDKELSIGDHDIAVGTMLMTPAGGTAAIMGDGMRGDTSGPSELEVDDGYVRISKGSITLDAQSANALAKFPGGSLTTKAGGAATASIEKDGAATIDAQRGETIVETAKGTQTLTAGETLTVTAKGDVEKAAPPPKRTVATIAAGESPIIHDAAAPTPLRITFAGVCIVEVAKDRTFKRVIARSGGTGGANVLVPVGASSYRAKCGGKTTTGTIRVAKDSGRAPLPKAAAKTLVEMDGREYTILYQNLLPELTLSWKAAPKKPPYAFVLKGTGGEKRFTSNEPKVTIPAGDVHEGSYTAWVEPKAGAKSEQGKIVIDFDNAAPSASLETVEANVTTIVVKGVVIEGSTVSANGAAVELDRQRRFTAQLTPGDAEDGAAIRIVNSKGGIHYYVVRAALP
jgi:hypothetical protein